MTLHFLGTIHNDSRGPQRLRRALEIEQPDIITVEGGETLLEYMSKEGNALYMSKIARARKLGLTPAACEFARWCVDNVNLYEILVSEQYAKERGIICATLEDSRPLEELKRNLQQDLRSQDIAYYNRLTQERLEEAVQRYYVGYDALFKGEVPGGLINEWVLSEEKQEKYKARDRLMAEEVKKHLVDVSNKVVFVGGLSHVLEDRFGNSLWSRLKKYSPTRATIGDEKYKIESRAG